MSAFDETSAARPADTVAGFLSALAMAIGLIGVVWHPLRLIPPAIVVALVAAAMTSRNQRLGFVAVLVVAACFFFGMLVAVITSRPLW
jgi:hypothetical protein